MICSTILTATVGGGAIFPSSAPTPHRNVSTSGGGEGGALSKGSATESNLRENINVRFKVGSVYLVYGQPGGWGGGCEKRGFPERVILIWCFYPGMIQCGRTDSVKGCSE